MCTVCGCASGNTLIGNMKRPDAPARGSKTVAWRAVGASPTDAPADHHTEATLDEMPAQVSEATLNPTAEPAPGPTAALVAAGAHPHHLHYGSGPAHAHAPGLTQGQMVRIERDILGKNDALAQANRKHLADRGIFALNLVSSPGSGKTTLLVETIRRLAGSIAVSVIEGDQQTEFDADRIRASGAPALQINTGKGCHLDADMIGRALARLDPPAGSLLLIENVGNLVCPAAFDLGEAHKVVILSITEGEDKPLKYPDMFAAADLMLLSKIDLAPYLDFDIERAIGYARQVKPDLQVITCSAKSGEGFDAWLAWIRSGVAAARENGMNETIRP